MPKASFLVYFATQHSAFAYRGDERFRASLEPGSVEDDKLMVKAIRDGADLFRSANECEVYCRAEMYPATNTGLIGKAPGRFLPLEIDGRKIYVGRSTSHD